MSAIVEKVNGYNQKEVTQFLENYLETSVYLLSNLENYGPKMTNADNSGDYQLIRQNGDLSGVFSLTKKGYLLIQTNRDHDFSEIILRSLAENPFNIVGVLSDWEIAKPFVDHFRSHHPDYEINFVSKQQIFRLKIHNSDYSEQETESRTRMLTESDFDEWDALSLAFLEETQLYSPGNQIERRRDFLERTKRKWLWGAFDNDRLVAISAYNTVYRNTAQVGSIYTSPKFRKQGYSRLCMQQLVKDSIKEHDVHRLFLNTANDHIVAMHLYETLGFKPASQFALIFGRFPNGLH